MTQPSTKLPTAWVAALVAEPAAGPLAWMLLISGLQHQLVGGRTIAFLNAHLRA